tara:strand:+ start:169 stop:381 length:213 start_codon:yes stop_codon:yes gene_type:complete
MKLRSGKILSSFFKPENQPFKLVLMPDKIPRKEDYAEDKGKYEVDIDFDEASRAWRKNKIHLGETGFRYK